MDTAANPTRPTEMPTALHKQGGWGRSAAQPPGPPLGAPAGRPQPPRGNARRRGFTLTELLVVIAIIAVLAALVTVAAVNALNAAKRARILNEVSQMSGAIEEFKNEFQAYPPSLMNNNDPSIVVTDIERMFKKMFPRSKEDPSVIRALAGMNPNSGTSLTSGPLQNGMTASEALYFWLGGFSDDSEYPLSGQGGPSFDTSVGEVLEERNRRWEFDLTRLVPRKDDAFDTAQNRFIQYTDPKNNNITRQINFWQYAPAGFNQPFVYFDASRKKPYEYDAWAWDTSTGPAVYAFKKVREGFNSNSTPTFRDLTFVNDGKYQIFHAGIDDAWGDSFSTYMAVGGANPNDGVPNTFLRFPDGPFTGEIADTLTNFFGGPISDAQEE